MVRFLSTVGLLMAICVAALPSVLEAYDLKPIVVQLRPAGVGSAQQMTITNTHKDPIAIEVKAYKREQLIDGTDKLTPEDQDIIITPPQMVIASGASQSFKVQWIGDPNPEKELAYRIVTSQLPIKFKTEKKDGANASMSFAYRYEAALYITPASAAPNAALADAQAVTDDKGATWLEVRIRNEGTARALLDKPAVSLRSSAGGDAVTLSGEQVGALQNLNILPASERKIRLPWPDGLAKTGLSGELKTGYTVLK